MSTLEKMQVLADSAQYDLCDYVSHSKSSQVNLPGIYHATGHNGCKIPLFKTLMTNKCKNDCKYCINQSKRNFTRLELSPEELSRAFLHYYNNGYVNGLFLSSGIGDTIDNTMEKTIETARILRKDYGYDDYIHLKIIPGASKDSIKRAMSLANRVSLNIEAATKDGLNEITSTKDYNKDILKRLDWMNQIAKKNPSFAKSGHTTQLIVGANDETDLEILKRMESLYKKVDLRRSYFSAFSPVEGTEFEKKEAREMDIFPVEINYASYKHLIRVPGIGPKSARRIMAIRRNRPFKKLEELQRIGVVVKRAEPYIKLDGNYQSALDNY